MTKKTYQTWRRLGIALCTACLSFIVVAADKFTPDDPLFATGWLAPVVVTTTNLEGTGSKLFRPYLPYLSWQGDLREYDIPDSGEVPDVTAYSWSALQRITAKTDADTDYANHRIVITGDASGHGMPFRGVNVWAHYSLPIESLLPSITTEPAVEPNVNFVRGGGNYYGVPRYLGSIIHSNPVYVGTPSANYSLSGYGDFQHANVSRPGRVYVGANDGMLHAFEATTGNEVFAYVPSMIIPHLIQFASNVSSHYFDYFVDGELTSADVQIGGSWRTVLVGGLGAGGCGWYALDVTAGDTPSSEGAASGKLLWEIKEHGLTCAGSGSSTLGYSYGRPSIARLSDGNWYAIMGNGYNSAAGTATLYVINIADGTVKARINTSASSCTGINGLSSPTVIDTDGNGAADYAYAGDIDGNMWKFDLRNVADLKLSYKVYAAGCNHAITTAPEVSPQPNGGYLVYFGTGRLLWAPDLTDATVQSVYGIWDRGTQLSSSANLFAQTQVVRTYGTATVRTNSTEDTPTWTGSTPNDGWRVDLPAGERVLTHPVLRAKRLQLVTINPTVANNENWLVEVNYLTGGASDRPIFDLNRDHLLDTNDYIDGKDDPLDRPLALLLGDGVMSHPVIVRLRNGIDATYINGLGLADTCATSCTAPSDMYSALKKAQSILTQMTFKGVDATSIAAQTTVRDTLKKQLDDANAALAASGGKVTFLSATAISEGMIEGAKAQRSAGATSNVFQQINPTPGPTFVIGPHSWVELYAQ